MIKLKNILKEDVTSADFAVDTYVRSNKFIVPMSKKELFGETPETSSNDGYTIYNYKLIDKEISPEELQQEIIDKTFKAREFSFTKHSDNVKEYPSIQPPDIVKEESTVSGDIATFSKRFGNIQTKPLPYDNDEEENQKNTTQKEKFRFNKVLLKSKKNKDNMF